MPVLGFDIAANVTDRQREEPMPERLDRDERISIPLDPEEALRRLLEVDPEAMPADPAATPEGESDE